MAYIQLGDVCNVVKGEIGITKAIPGEYPMVTTGEERKSHNSFQLDTKAVLVPLVSATGHGHASIKRIHYQEGKFAFGSILAACIPKDESYSAEFLYIYFQLMKDYVLVPLMKGSANVSLTLTNLKTAKVPDVSIEIQKDIIQLYSKLRIEQGQAIDILSIQKNDIEALKQAILQEAVQGKLTTKWRANNTNIEPASELLKRIEAQKQQLIDDKKIKKEKPLSLIEEVPFKIPEGWNWIKLGDLMSMFNGRAFKKHEWSNEGLPIIRIQNLNNPNATFNFFNGELDDKHHIQKGTFLISWSGTPGTSFGAFIWNGKDGALNQHINKCVFHSDRIDEEFYKRAINSQLYKLIEQAQGGVGLKHVTKGILNNLILPLPPLEEQKAIVEKVNSLMALCDELEQQIETSQTQIEVLMQSCLKEVFEH